jgi:D-tagatose-1,6-bisphosphate aldolase subunit GatZ/KbaZ
MQPRLGDLIAAGKAAGRKFTLLGIGPVSEAVLESAMRVCRRRSFPPVFIASRNQVDSFRFGGGYLLGGIDQAGFVALIRDIQQRVGYEGPLYICRDHGGPWQRDAELRSKLPVPEAMDLARQSLAEDLRAGFNYLHIDPTKCPLPFTQKELVAWTLELVAYCEQVRGPLGIGPVDYEIGAEDIQGSVTSEREFGSFLEKTIGAVEQAHLPLPTCIVGQTGTLTRLDRNVGRFDREQTARLAAVAGRFGVGLKEHNGDYLSAASCRIHPDIGVTGMNVAPEFGLVETDTLLALDALEAKLFREGWIGEGEVSGLGGLLRELAFDGSPWEKWLTADLKKLPRGEVAGNEALRTLIARVCGHYVFSDERLVRARRTLFGNLDRFRMAEPDAASFAAGRIEESIEFYVRHFRLEGLNGLLSA